MENPLPYHPQLVNPLAVPFAQSRLDHAASLRHLARLAEVDGSHRPVRWAENNPNCLVHCIL